MTVSIRSQSLIRTYSSLTKPGIIFGNAVTAASGFALASKGHFNLLNLLGCLLGLSLVIASACVFNNYIDRNADQQMERTKHRPLANGLVSIKSAIAFASALLLIGSLLLLQYANLLSLFTALFGFLVYVFCYSLLKYRTPHATLIGSIAGAVPPVVGYVAAKGSFDLATLLLFAIVVFWQMPHFYAIALYRLSDYTSANIPVLPSVSGPKATKIQMLVYVIGFIIASTLPSVFGYTGYYCLAVSLTIGSGWLILAVRGFKTDKTVQWARAMFFYSLIAIILLSAMIAVDIA